IADGSVDAVVACLVYEHIDDMDAAVAEVARVLAPGGRFLLFLNHPLLQTPGSGWIDDQVLDPPEQYWRARPHPSQPRTSPGPARTGPGGGRRGGSSRPPTSASCPGRCRATSTPWRSAACSSSGWSSRRRRPVSWPWHPSTPMPPPSPGCCTSVPSATTAD